MMKAYHAIKPDQLESALINGLDKRSRGEKGDDSAIYKTDQLLDQLRPDALTQAGVSRDDNLYAYLVTDAGVADIADGSLVPESEFIAAQGSAVVRVEIDPKRCYVSDLDMYDAVKQALVELESRQVIETLVSSYWKKLTRLDTYLHGDTRRPEIMITYSVPPQFLTRV